MAEVIIAELSAPPVHLVSLEHLLSAVIARCDASFVPEQLNVKLGRALVRVQYMPLWTVSPEALLELVS